MDPTSISIYYDTMQVMPYPIDLDGKRIVLVDTPGLDNHGPELEDDKICEAIVRSTNLKMHLLFHKLKLQHKNTM